VTLEMSTEQIGQTKRRFPSGVIRLGGLVVALVVPLAVASVLLPLGQPRGGRSVPVTQPTRSEDLSRPGPGASLAQEHAYLQSHGPLLLGVAVTLERAMQVTPYRLPIPPTNDRTGPLTAVWYQEQGERIAFVWETDLSVLVEEEDRTQAELLDNYQAHVAEDPGLWFITTVRGRPALGADRGGPGDNASLSFAENGIDISLISPTHSLEELKGFAEAISYE
jgi:hypothetical protein